MNRLERISIVILCFVLFLGAVILYKRNTRPFKKIFIAQDEINLTSIKEEIRQKQKVNINRASIDELTCIPGIGKSLAERIVKHREEYGSFSSENELLKVKGIGLKKLNKMEDFMKI